MKEFYDEMEGKTLMELAAAMNQLRVDLEEAKAKKVSLQKKYDALRLNLVPSAMENDNVSNVTIKGIGRVGLASDIYVSIPAVTKDQAWAWLVKNGLGDIIKPTIHSGTLKATMRGILKRGEVIPPDDLFKITPFTRASITKR